MNPAAFSLSQLLRTMQPELNEGVYVFATVPATFDAYSLQPIAIMREKEGLSVVVEETRAKAAGLDALFRAAWISLNVHSDLSAVGLTAAFASALANAGISCNVIAGAFHDHIFVSVDKADNAMQVLRELQADSQH